MATSNRLRSGYWRAQVRRKGHAISRSFKIKADAEDWARDQETLIEKGLKPKGKTPETRETIADRGGRDLGIEDLHFHDLRHEAISRLFEADWDIPMVAAVSGHIDWKMLQRYTHLRPTFIASRSGRARLAAERAAVSSSAT
jgi:integrase